MPGVHLYPAWYDKGFNLSRTKLLQNVEYQAGYICTPTKNLISRYKLENFGDPLMHTLQINHGEFKFDLDF